MKANAASGNCATYAAQHGCHPPIVLGNDCGGTPSGYFFGCGQGSCSGSFDFVLPMSFTSKLGSFRLGQNFRLTAPGAARRRARFRLSDGASLDPGPF